MSDTDKLYNDLRRWLDARDKLDAAANGALAAKVAPAKVAQIIARTRNPLFELTAQQSLDLWLVKRGITDSPTGGTLRELLVAAIEGLPPPAHIQNSVANAGMTSHAAPSLTGSASYTTIDQLPAVTSPDVSEFGPNPIPGVTSNIGISAPLDVPPPPQAVTIFTPSPLPPPPDPLTIYNSMPAPAPVVPTSTVAASGSTSRTFGAALSLRSGLSNYDNADDLAGYVMIGDTGAVPAAIEVPGPLKSIIAQGAAREAAAAAEAGIPGYQSTFGSVLLIAGAGVLLWYLLKRRR